MITVTLRNGTVLLGQQTAYGPAVWQTDDIDEARNVADVEAGEVCQIGRMWSVRIRREEKGAPESHSKTRWA